MGKKYIVISGKKHFIKDVDETADVADVEDEEAEADDEVADDAADFDAEEKKLAKNLAKKIVADLGLDQVSELSKTVANLVKSQYPTDAKLTKILNGKDYIRDKDKLTPNEKIVGFFHSLVTGNEHATKALSEGTAADGGYLFPDEFLAEVIRDVAELNVMRSLVRIIPMRRDVMKIPELLSGPDVYWTAENAAKTTTTAHFSERTLTVKKMAAIIYASDELIEDSSEIDIVQLIIRMFAEKIADREEQAIVVGNGTTQPTGLETARSAGSIAAVAASTHDFDDILTLEYSLPAKYSNQAAFIANRNTIKELRKLKDSQNRYQWQPSPAAGQPATLNGKPVYEVNYLPNGTIYFGDFKQGYFLGDRKQMTVKITQDSETAFTKDQTAIRVVHRIAGNVGNGAALRALTGF